MLVTTETTRGSRTCPSGNGAGSRYPWTGTLQTHMNRSLAGGAKRPPPVPLTKLSMAKKLCTTAPAVVEQRIPLHVRTPKRATPDAHTLTETTRCTTNKNSMLASSQIFNNPEKPCTTLTKVLTTLGSPGSTRNKSATPTVTKIARPQQTLLPDDLGEFISRDAAAVTHLG